MASAVDIEPLPGQPDEQVLQVGPRGVQPGNADAGQHELTADPFGRLVGEPGADLIISRLDVGQPESGQGRRRLAGLRGADDHPAAALAPELVQRALEHQPPGPHHADVSADLLHLGEQVGGDEDRHAVGGDLPDQATHLAGALRVQAVGGLIQDDQLPGPEQAGRDRQALLHAQRVRTVALLGRAEQPHPVQRRVDPCRRGARVGGPVGGVHPGQVGPAGQVRVEGRALDQRAHPRQDPGGRPGDRLAEQADAAASRVDQAEQHPDGGGLPGSVRPEEAIDRAARYGQAEVVHRELTAAEPLGQPAGGDGQAGRLQRAGWPRLGRAGLGLGASVGSGACRAHLSCAAALYSTDGATAPIRTWPLLVIRMETRLVVTSLPLPQAPLTGVADLSRAASIPAASTLPLEPGPPAADWAAWPTAAAALPCSIADRTDAGRTATASQPLPTTFAPDTAGGGPAGMAWRCGVTVRTLAPFGGVKAKVEAGGAAKVMEVKPVWNAGVAAPRAKSCSPSTTPGCCASIWTTTRPTRERLSLGATTSW